jgi:hypothetical protein
MLRRVARVRIDVPEELSASIIKMTRIGELGTTLAVISNRRRVRRLLVNGYVPTSPILVILMIKALSTSGTSILTRATRRNIQEDAILRGELLFSNSFPLRSASHTDYFEDRIPRFISRTVFATISCFSSSRF